MVVAFNPFDLLTVSNAFTDSFTILTLLLRLELFFQLLLQKFFDVALASQLLRLVPEIDDRLF